MSSYSFYFLGIILIVFSVGFVGFYGYRLRSARKRMGDDSAARLGQLLRAAQPVAAPVVRGVESLSAPGGGAPSVARIYERGPGLGGIGGEPVFLRRDRTGEVSFQVGEKPAMPLKYLLDAKTRLALDQLSMRATADFGQSWAILASEDEEGRLTVTRLL